MKLFTVFFGNLKRSQVISHIEDEVTFRSQYFLILFLSVIIATLGLIINNSAIIIGAMLLSPLIWPIIGVSLATVSSTENLMRKSIFLLFSSVIFIIVTAFLISLLSPFKELGTEVLSRTNPTLFDLVIALAAGVAATFILTWPKFSDALAGVAIAASLLPPICVTGIGIAFNDSSIAYGSFILFLTNLSSIIFAGIIVFSLARFHKRQDEGYVKRLSLGLLFSFIIIGALSSHLIFSLRQILNENRIKYNVVDTLSRELSILSEDISLDTVEIKIVQENSFVNINADIKVPSHIIITTDYKNHLVTSLQDALSLSIDLKMSITQVIEAITLDSSLIEKANYNQNIERIIGNAISGISSKIEIQSVSSSIDIDGEKSFFIETVWRVPERVDITYFHKKELLDDLTSELDAKVNLEISLINYTEVVELVDEESFDVVSYTKNLLKERSIEFFKSVEGQYDLFFLHSNVLWNSNQNSYELEIGLAVPVGSSIPIGFVDGLKSHLGVIFSPITALSIDLQLFEFTSFNI